MRISNAVRISVAAASLVVAAGAAGCSDTVDGRAICIGCGPTEPGLPNPTPPTTSTPSGPTLDPSESGYVYIQTKSGLTRCQLNTASVGCEAPFENPPELNGEPANGVEVTADGSVRWLVGNLGDIPATTLDYSTYHAVGWTIEATNDGTRFTNDGTGHGMFVSIEKVEIF